MKFPDGRRFAFSILDDTDDSTLENIEPIYQLLLKCGMRTTKTVWPVDCPEGSRLFFAADTLQRGPYLKFVKELVSQGFELAFHGATMESSRRERTVEALEFMRAQFGVYPRLYCNHGQNRENLYWGHKRIQTFILRWLSALHQREPLDHFCGEREGSEYFWGDLCQKHFAYVRNFTFDKVNLEQVRDALLYTLPDTPYVNFWFSTADAQDVDAFVDLMRVNVIDELEQQGGICIISTHLGKGFVQDGQVEPSVRSIIEYLGGKAGWFVPVSVILDHVRAQLGGGRMLTSCQRIALECRFLADKLVSAPPWFSR